LTSLKVETQFKMAAAAAAAKWQLPRATNWLSIAKVHAINPTTQQSRDIQKKRLKWRWS